MSSLALDLANLYKALTEGSDGWEFDIAGLARDAVQEITRLQAENARLKAERDAAANDMQLMVRDRLLGFCTFCKHREKPDLRYMPCKKCHTPNGGRALFAWRGLEAHNDKK